MKLLLFLIFCCTLFCFPIADTTFLTPPTWGWFPLSNLYTNTYGNWKIPLYGMIGNYSVTVISLIAIYIVGGFLLFRDKPFSHKFFYIITSSILMFNLIGIDTQVISAVSFLPLLLWSLQYSSILALCVFIPFLLHANYFAFLSLPLIIGLSSRKKSRHDSAIQFDLICIATLCLIMPFLHPPLEFPQYPQGAHVVPRTGTILGKDPWVGASHALSVVDSSFQHPFMGLFLVIAMAVSFYSIIRSQNLTHEQSVIRPLSWVTFGYAASLFIDSSWVYPELRILSPLRSIGRIFPELISVSMMPVCLALLCLGLTLIAFSSKDNSIREAVLGCFVVSLVGSAAYTLPSYQISFGNLLFPNKTHIDSEVLISPSLYPVKNFSTYHRLITSWRPIQSENPTPYASHNQEELQKLFFHQTERWSSGQGKQTGKEWIAFEFETPKIISGVDLSVAKYQSDFPRGLRIYSAVTCRAKLFAVQEEIIAYPIWSGGLIDQGDGPPYLSHESMVIVPFNHGVSTKCLVIEQIGTSTNFDWSVEKVFIF